MDCVWSGFIGAIIGVLSSYGVVMFREHVENNACIKAIDSEIRCLNQMCIETFDITITDDNTPLNLSYPLCTDYFAIFNANTSKIGKVRDDLKRELIVAIYITGKYFLDCLRTNNECLDLYEQADKKYRVDTTNVYLRKDLEFAKSNLEHSKVNNILPTYKKLKHLLNLYLNS